MVTHRSWAFLCWALSLSLGFGVLISWPARLVAQTSVALPKELQSVALPNDIHIVRPQADVPSDLAAFSGMWGGVWDYSHSLPTILVVESITTVGGPQAIVVYAWGVPAGSRATYRMRSDVRLDGNHSYQGYSAKAILKRIEQP